MESEPDVRGWPIPRSVALGNPIPAIILRPVAVTRLDAVPAWTLPAPRPPTPRCWASVWKERGVPDAR